MTTRHLGSLDLKNGGMYMGISQGSGIHGSSSILNNRQEKEEEANGEGNLEGNEINTVNNSNSRNSEDATNNNSK